MKISKSIKLAKAPKAPKKKSLTKAKAKALIGKKVGKKVKRKKGEKE